MGWEAVVAAVVTLLAGSGGWFAHVVSMRKLQAEIDEAKAREATVRLQTEQASRDNRQEAVDSRYQRLLDEQQAAIERLRQRELDRDTHQSVLHEQVTLLQKQMVQQQESRKRLIKRYRMVERRHERERTHDAAKIATLERRVEQLTQALKDANIPVPPPLPAPSTNPQEK